jgi:hypothetical protein
VGVGVGGEVRSLSGRALVDSGLAGGGWERVRKPVMATSNDIKKALFLCACRVLDGVRCGGDVLGEGAGEKSAQMEGGENGGGGGGGGGKRGQRRGMFQQPLAKGGQKGVDEHAGEGECARSCLGGACGGGGGIGGAWLHGDQGSEIAGDRMDVDNGGGGGDTAAGCSPPPTDLSASRTLPGQTRNEPPAAHPDGSCIGSQVAVAAASRVLLVTEQGVVLQVAEESRAHVMAGLQAAFARVGWPCCDQERAGEAGREAEEGDATEEQINPTIRFAHGLRLGALA